MDLVKPVLLDKTQFVKSIPFPLLEIAAIFETLLFSTFDSIEILSQNIDKIIKEIFKSKEEEDLKNKEIKKENNEIPILADKFLIIENINKSVNKNLLQKEELNTSEINNESTSVDKIEIEEIILPKKYSINSLMEFFGNCILKTQILPAFIRYAVKINDENQKKKSN